MADEVVSDRAYDEAIAVETDDDEVSTPASSEAESPPAKAAGNQRNQGKPAASGGKGDSSSEESSSSEGSSSGDESDEDNSKSPGGKSIGASGGYNPDDYKNMKVSSEVEELFQHITRYKPHTIELDTVLKPFIPELIPSIGEVDAYLKMPRPDGQASGLGATQIDEPTLNPSDPSILDLQLRSLSKAQDLQPMEVRSIENAEKSSKEIENWVKRIDELNRSKPAPTVQYSRRMPDIEQLMQVWPGELEEFLQQNPLPELADLCIELPDYVRLIASILDVPVYSQLTETLHVIFTLYSEFKSNQHFSKTDAGGLADPYNFSAMPNFGAGTTGVQGAAASNAFGGPMTQSMAPSRAPSPVGHASG